MALTWRGGACGPVVRPLAEPAGTLPPADQPQGSGTITAAGGIAATGTAALHGAGAQASTAHLGGLDWRPGVCGPVVRPISEAGGAFPPAFSGFGEGHLSALGGITIPATAAESGTGTLAAGASVAIHGAATEAGHGTLAAAGRSVTPEGFILAIAVGDLSTAGTTLTPSGWTPLHTVTASNGTDHSADVVLAAACNTTTASASVTATSSANEDIAAAMTGVIVGAQTPVPPGINPAWPYTVFEAAFGSGLLTAPDAKTWTNLQAFSAGKRCRAWKEDTGVQFELGSLESTQLELELDNPDGFLTPGNSASPWAPFVVPGTPVRLRCVPPASTGVQAWTVIERAAESWPESWDNAYRGMSNATGTDAWSIANRSLRSPYRAEVAADAPYAWWPCDDQPVLGGVAPVTLRNAAAGNTTPLSIQVSPHGTFFSDVLAGIVYLATGTVASDSGWMYGDPSSTAGPGGPGGPVTAQPGSFSWRHSGNGGLTTGQWLTANDPGFPPLSGGVTVEGWWNYEFATAATLDSTGDLPPNQPVGNLVIWEMATSTAPVAVLYLDTSGHLQFTAAGTTTTIYSGGDLRNTSWMGITATLTQSAWAVWLNGGATAKVSGTASFASNWTWINFGASMGSGGGGSTSGITGLGDAAHSALAVYPRVLPPSRIVSHYLAAVTGFGLVPAPSSPAVQYVKAGDPLPSGSLAGGGFGSTTASTMAVTVAATVGSFTSGPSAEAVSVNDSNFGAHLGGDYYLGWKGVAPTWNVYTATQTRAEKLQAASGKPWSDQTGGGYGSGASPPSTPTPTGDNVAQRIERLMASGNIAVPRCIDHATALVQAALDTAGSVSGTTVSNITASDGGLLYMDNLGALCYWSRPHLAGSQVAWQLGPNVAAGQIPYLNDDASLSTDPQRIRNSITITPYAPDGSSLPLITPTDTVAAATSQEQYGEQDLQLTSYIQSETLQQEQADWFLANFGVARKRVVSLTVNAAGMTASCPAAWLYCLGANIGDLVQVTVGQPGQPTLTYTLRISHISRNIEFRTGTASITAALDYEAPSYWGV